MSNLKALISAATVVCCLSGIGWCGDINKESLDPIISDLIVQRLTATMPIPGAKFTVSDILYVNSGGNNYIGKAKVALAAKQQNITFPVSFSMICDGKAVFIDLNDPSGAYYQARYEKEGW